MVSTERQVIPHSEPRKEGQQDWAVISCPVDALKGWASIRTTMRIFPLGPQIKDPIIWKG